MPKKPNLSARGMRMAPEEVISLVDGITVHRRKDRRAPHKPLMLLYALGHLDAGRLLPFAEIEGPMKNLLSRYGHPGDSRPRPEFPFWRLRNDGLWDIPEHASVTETESGDAHIRELRRLAVAGGFSPDVFDALRRDRKLVADVAQMLLAEFPDTMRGDLIREVGLAGWDLRPGQKRLARNPAFRENVLRAYGRCCAVCGYDLRIGDNLFGLEAAHIRWHRYAGPDHVRNGLALCSFHHKAFDYGAFTLAPDGDGYVVQVSRDVSGQSPTAGRLRKLHDMSVRPPLNGDEAPDSEHVLWHRQEVFRPPPLMAA